MNMHSLPGTLLSAALVATLLGGCDSSSPTSSSSSSVHQTIKSARQLSGHVLNDDGPITQGRIEIRDANGHAVTQIELQGQDTYKVTVPAGTVYPLVLTAHPANSADEILKAAVTDPDATEQVISPVTTIVVTTAMNLGGLTETNLAKAAGAAIATRKKSGGGGGSRTTTQSFNGDPTKQYGGWH